MGDAQAVAGKTTSKTILTSHKENFPNISELVRLGNRTGLGVHLTLNRVEMSS